MDLTATYLVVAVKEIDDCLEFDQQFTPFYHKGIDIGHGYPGTEIQHQVAYIVKEADERWGDDWVGLSVACPISFYPPNKDLPDDYTDTLIYMK